MKRITLAFVALTAGSVVGLAQEPPTPPTPPARPVPAPAPSPVSPVPPTAPVPAPRAVRIPRDLDYDIDRDYEREIARHAADVAREAARIDQDQAREIARQAQEAARQAVRIDQDNIREIARVNAERFSRDFAAAPMALSTPYISSPRAIAPMAPMAPIVTPAPFVTFGGRDFTDRSVPAPWVQGDPADSVYRIAREALNNGDYGRAARMFNEVVQKYASKSQLTDASQYYEALARYKIGTTDELHQSAKILKPMVAKLPPRATNTTNSGEVSNAVRVGIGQGCGGYGCTMVYNTRNGFGDSEVATLYIRVNGALAQRGDAEAQQELNRVAPSIGSPCDREDTEVKVEILNNIARMDAPTWLPAIKRVLERKDDCSVSLRRAAVFVLGGKSEADVAPLLIATAKSDPSIDVRISAINFLGRLPGDAGLATLDDLLKNDPDERIQRAVIRALNSSDNPKARSGMRTLIDRKDAPLNLRIEAINSFSSDRATTDDAAYLRGLYPRAENDQMKEAILNTLSRIGGTDNDVFVLSVAKNSNESSRTRSAALSRLSRSPTVTTADLAKIYDAAESYDVRSRIVQILGSRRDSESADKLIDIAKTSTVPQIKKEAVQAIIRRNDPRATQLLNDMIEGKKP
ncbi:MAG TPA: HEAT repeat domain-containing protein [Gemmatimonadaceae bacterium]|jgi:HEAT repeat protein/TolA-binding protein|nr:HEAT repeat domain-containing protein [Gemmatimonadaceae bacterium]